MRSFITVVVVVLGFTAALVVDGCDPGTCRADGDCATGVCIDGGCFDCRTSDDCPGGTCCNGSCTAADVDDICGCAAAPRGDRGTSCEASLCLVGRERATSATVGDGVCDCPCSPADGGSVCIADASATDGFVCGCDRNDPVGTCEGASIDVNGIPHRPADTCSPTSSCVCFAAGGTCGAGENCTADGCINLDSDDNCGVANRVCSNAATGVVDGVCNDGGCTCDAPSDCRGEGLNVDDCAFGRGDVLQCLCNGYVADGDQAPCPLGLPCVEGGCRFDGSVYATKEALLDALVP